MLHSPVTHSAWSVFTAGEVTRIKPPNQALYAQRNKNRKTRRRLSCSETGKLERVTPPTSRHWITLFHWQAACRGFLRRPVHAWGGRTGFLHGCGPWTRTLGLTEPGVCQPPGCGRRNSQGWGGEKGAAAGRRRRCVQWKVQNLVRGNFFHRQTDSTESNSTDYRLEQRCCHGNNPHPFGKMEIFHCISPVL